MKQDYSEVEDIVVRYGVIVLGCLFGMTYLERILSFSTITVLTGVLTYFYGDVAVFGRYVLVDGQIFEIARECVVGMVYGVLFVLVFSTAKVSLVRRLAALMITWVLTFALNLARMCLLVFVVKTSYFHEMHGLFQYILAPVWLFWIWIMTARLLEIQAVPVYSDAKYLWDLIGKSSRHRRQKVNAHFVPMQKIVILAWLGNNTG